MIPFLLSPLFCNRIILAMLIAVSLTSFLKYQQLQILIPSTTGLLTFCNVRELVLLPYSLSLLSTSTSYFLSSVLILWIKQGWWYLPLVLQQELGLYFDSKNYKSIKCLHYFDTLPMQFSYSVTLKSIDLILLGALLLVCDIIPCTGYLDNVDSVSYAYLPNVDNINILQYQKNNIC